MVDVGDLRSLLGPRPSLESRSSLFNKVGRLRSEEEFEKDYQRKLIDTETTIVGQDEKHKGEIEGALFVTLHNTEYDNEEIIRRHSPIYEEPVNLESIAVNFAYEDSVSESEVAEIFVQSQKLENKRKPKLKRTQYLSDKRDAEQQGKERLPFRAKWSLQRAANRRVRVKSSSNVDQLSSQDDEDSVVSDTGSDIELTFDSSITKTPKRLSSQEQSNEYENNLLNSQNIQKAKLPNQTLSVPEQKVTSEKKGPAASKNSFEKSMVVKLPEKLTKASLGEQKTKKVTLKRRSIPICPVTDKGVSGNKTADAKKDTKTLPMNQGKSEEVKQSQIYVAKLTEESLGSKDILVDTSKIAEGSQHVETDLNVTEGDRIISDTIVEKEIDQDILNETQEETTLAYSDHRVGKMINLNDVVNDQKLQFRGNDIVKLNMRLEHERKKRRASKQQSTPTVFIIPDSNAPVTKVSSLKNSVQDNSVSSSDSVRSTKSPDHASKEYVTTIVDDDAEDVIMVQELREKVARSKLKSSKVKTSNDKDANKDLVDLSQDADEMSKSKKKKVKSKHKKDKAFRLSKKKKKKERKRKRKRRKAEKEAKKDQSDKKTEGKSNPKDSDALALKDRSARTSSTKPTNTDSASQKDVSMLDIDDGKNKNDEQEEKDIDHENSKQEKKNEEDNRAFPESDEELKSTKEKLLKQLSDTRAKKGPEKETEVLPSKSITKNNNMKEYSTSSKESRAQNDVSKNEFSDSFLQKDIKEHEIEEDIPLAKFPAEVDTESDIDKPLKSLDLIGSSKSENVDEEIEIFPISKSEERIIGLKSQKALDHMPVDEPKNKFAEKLRKEEKQELYGNKKRSSQGESIPPENRNDKKDQEASSSKKEEAKNLNIDDGTGPSTKSKSTKNIIQPSSSLSKQEPKILKPVLQKTTSSSKVKSLKQSGIQEKFEEPSKKDGVIKEQAKIELKETSNKKVTIKTDNSADRKSKTSTKTSIIKTSTPKISKTVSKLGRAQKPQDPSPKRKTELGKKRTKKQEESSSSSDEDSSSSSSEDEGKRSNKAKTGRKDTLKKAPKLTGKTVGAKKDSKPSNSNSLPADKVQKRDDNALKKDNVSSNRANNVLSRQALKENGESQKKVSAVTSKPSTKVIDPKKTRPAKPQTRPRKRSVSSSSASSSSSSESDTDSSSESSSSDSESEEETESSSSSSESSYSSSSSDTSDSESDASEEGKSSNKTKNQTRLKQQRKTAESTPNKILSAQSTSSVTQAQTKDKPESQKLTVAAQPVCLMIPRRRKSKSLSLEAPSSGDDLVGNSKDEKVDIKKDKNDNQDIGSKDSKQGSKPIYRDHQGRNYYAEDFGIDPHQSSGEEGRATKSKSTKSRRRSRSDSGSPERGKRRTETNSRSAKVIPKQYQRSANQRSSDSKDSHYRRSSNSGRSERHKKSHSDRRSHSSRSHSHHSKHHSSSSSRKRRSSENRHDSSSKIKKQNWPQSSHTQIPMASLKAINTTDFWKRPQSNNPNLMPISSVQHIRPTNVQVSSLNPIQQQTHIASNLMKLASYPTAVPQASVDLLNSVNIAQQHQLQDPNLLRTIQNEISANQQMMMLINPLNPSTDLSGTIVSSLHR